MSVTLTPIVIESGACLRVDIEGCETSLLLDAGSSEFGVPDLPFDREPFPSSNLDNYESDYSRYERLQPYFRPSEQVVGMISHHHQDHISLTRALSWLLSDLDSDYRFYMSNLAQRFAQRHIFYAADMPGERPKIGGFITGERVEYDKGLIVTPYHVCHSTPKTHIFVVETPIGAIVYLSDFTFGRYSEDQVKYTEELLVGIGQLNPKLLVIESLYSDRDSGQLTGLESAVNTGLREEMQRAISDSRRTVIATFGSNSDRIASILHITEQMGRTSYLMGAPWRYLEDLQGTGIEMAYPINWSLLQGYKHPERVDVLITSGCQAEENAHLTLASLGVHDSLQIGDHDTVIISANPIPGNEEKVRDMVNRLILRGAEVVLPNNLKGHPMFQFEGAGLVRFADIHTSGHEDLYGKKKAIELIKPEMIMPYHAGSDQRQVFTDCIEEDYPEIRVLLPNEGETITLD